MVTKVKVEGEKVVGLVSPNLLNVFYRNLSVHTEIYNFSDFHRFQSITIYV